MTRFQRACLFRALGGDLRRRKRVFLGQSCLFWGRAPFFWGRAPFFGAGAPFLGAKAPRGAPKRRLCPRKRRACGFLCLFWDKGALGLPKDAFALKTELWAPRGRIIKRSSKDRAKTTKVGRNHVLVSSPHHNKLTEASLHSAKCGQNTRFSWTFPDRCLRN